MCTPKLNKVSAKRATWSRRPSVARHSKTTAAATLPTLAVVHQFTNCWHDLAINQFGSAVAGGRGGGRYSKGWKNGKERDECCPPPGTIIATMERQRHNQLGLRPSVESFCIRQANSLCLFCRAWKNNYTYFTSQRKHVKIPHLLLQKPTLQMGSKTKRIIR
jgi:hypothetical protein